MLRKFRFPALFFALSLIYFSRELWSGLLLATGDGRLEFYPLRAVTTEIIKQGLLPLWNPYMFLGFPLFASMQPSSLYPVSFIFLFLPHEFAHNLGFVLHTTMAGFFVYLYAKLITGRDFPSAMAGIVFGFLGYFQTTIQHIPIYYTMTWLPLILYLIEKLRVERTMIYVFATALGIAIQIYAGHPQIIVQSQMLIAMYVLLHALWMDSRQRFRFMGMSAAAVALGFLLAAPQLIATYELSTLAYRAKLSYKVFSQFSFPPHLFPSLLFPFLWGTGSEYWGYAHYMRMTSAFAGTLPLIVAVLVPIMRWRPNVHVRVWGIIGIVAFVLALGNTLPFVHKIVFHIPVLNLFRAPSRHFLEVHLAIAALFSIGVARIMEKDRALIKLIITTLLGLAGLSLLVILVIQSLRGHVDPFSLNLMKPELFVVKTSLISPSVLVPLLTMCASVAALLFFLKFSARTAKPFGALLLFSLALIVFSEGLYFKEKDPPFPSSDSVRIQKQSRLFDYLSKRTERAAFIFISYGNRTQDLLPITRGISMMNGYDPLITRNLSDLLDMEGIGFSHRWNDLISYNLILSMLNTKYLIVPDEKVPVVEAVRGRVVEDLEGEKGFVPPIGPGLPPRKDFQPIYEKLFDSEYGTVYLNKNALPRVYSVDELIETRGIKETIRKFYSFRADPRRQAMVLPDAFKELGSRGFSRGRVEIKEYRPNEVVIYAKFNERGFVVLADQYYPGWKAYVDGKETKIYRTNGVMRGVVLLPGTHELAFRYRPTHIYVSMAISAVALIATLAGIFMLKRK